MCSSDPLASRYAHLRLPQFKKRRLISLSTQTYRRVRDSRRCTAANGRTRACPQLFAQQRPKAEPRRSGHCPCKPANAGVSHSDAARHRRSNYSHRTAGYQVQTQQLKPGICTANQQYAMARYDQQNIRLAYRYLHR